MSINEASEKIRKEYPDLKFKIIKQFSSKGIQKRTYNSFLLETSEYGLIIAKSFVVNPKILELEWNIINQLNKENKNAPNIFSNLVVP